MQGYPGLPLRPQGQPLGTTPPTVGVVVVDADVDVVNVVVVDGVPPVPQHGEPENQHYRRTPWSRKG